MIELSRYVLEPLRTDEEFILYRGQSQDGTSRTAFASYSASSELGRDSASEFGRDPTSEGRSPVLVLSPVTEHPRPESLKRLEHECSLKEELEPAWAARPIGLTRQWGRTVLLLEDPGGILLESSFAEATEDKSACGRMGPAAAGAYGGKGDGLDLAFCLRVGISLANAVGHLHRRGIVHKDIKPANVLVNSATGQVWLMGFGIASRLPRERKTPDLPEFLEGTLAYMAPEQTGRMNRSTDSRSDLYSLGVTLYQMVTGSLPFTASDPMEWVHCHIARKPPPPSERLENVPQAVSAIIMKLLAKTAEERYQTAAGVESDLRRCLDAVGLRQAQSSRTSSRSSGIPRTNRSSSESTELVEVLPESIAAFPLGEHDTPDRLLIPEKLYGRASETETLLASFDRVVKGGAPELVLVSGYSGIGKSSVVNELHRVLIPSRGLFASGKFDQYKRDIPYSTLVQAFQSLVGPLLGKNDTDLAICRGAFLEALDPNARLMTDLIPELKLIIGDPTPVPELEPQQAQSRFQLVFRRFIGVFARPEHPLALFLDDLQWLDGATLDLLEDLLARSDLQHLMLIGAYRDNEVDAAHPLTRKLDAIRQAGSRVQEIRLAPLALNDVGQLIADAIRCDPAYVAPLAQLVHEKTAGNPFFVIQFLQALAEEGLLRFNHDAACWRWDLYRIHTKGYTDNVVDLMVGKVTRLPAETQQALQQLACLGNVAATAMLSTVLATAEEQLHAVLWPAVRQELVERPEGYCRFVHDRVQEAAYSLIPEALRAEAHLRIGRLLAAQTPAEKREEAVFDIVGQLNRGAALITQQEERYQLAELNLIAGKRAKGAAAYTSALTYLVTGGKLLNDDCWERRHQLIFALELHRAECEFLTGQPSVADERLAALSNRATTTVEQAMVACLHIDVCITVDQSSRAVAVGLNYLRQVGIEWSPHPKEEEVRREYERVWSLLGGRTTEDLIDLPLLEDAASLATVDVLVKVVPAAWYTDANLVSLTLCRAVSLSLERGNCDASCQAYVQLGGLAGRHFGDYKAGFRFGELGYGLVERRGLKRFEASTYECFSVFIVRWTKHVRACRDLMRRAFAAANRIGDLTWAAYTCCNGNSDLLLAGEPLPELQGEVENGLAFVEEARFSLVVDIITTQLALIRMLRGLTPKFGCFDDGQFNELHMEHHLSSNPALTIATCWYWVRKLQARYIAGDYGTAIDAASKAQRLLWTSYSFYEEAEYHFYDALTRAASCDSATADEREQHLDALAAHHKQLQVWAGNCPENFENRAALVGAEIARIEGRALDAIELYEQAIRSARANGFVHNEAIAYEVAARFYAGRGFEEFARVYLQKARYGYQRWGADGKVRQLDELYPGLREREPAPGPADTIGAPLEHLDLATVIKVSQAISSEIVFEKLIDTLMRTAVEHAGAERGVLILRRGNELRAEAEATTKGEAIVVRLGALSVVEAKAPESIVQYAMHTGENVILDDALVQNPFSTDQYIRLQRVRSILCLPLIKQARVAGVLYLENNLAPRVFTPTRITVLKLLASQAAICLENTLLYRDLGEREAKIRRLVDANIIGIFIWSLDGEIIEANEAFLRMVGYSREDLISGHLRWTDLTPADWRDADDRAIAELKLTGTIQPIEKEFLRRDGVRMPVLIGGALFEGSENNGVAYVLDLSERKRAEEALRHSEEAGRKAQAELAHVSRVATMGELTTSIAHEINQPLTAAVNSASACLRWLAANDLAEARQSTSRVIASVRRAGEIIAGIRALAKKAPPQKQPLDLNETIGEAITMVRSELHANNVSLQTQLANDLPLIKGDRVQLEQVILNLIINASEAMAKIEEDPRILTVSSERSADLSGNSEHVTIAVRDSGPGLDMTSLDRLFDTFYTTKPQGLGMGLAISRSIIEAHGGRLWAENAVRGAVFQFSLPIHNE